MEKTITITLKQLFNISKCKMFNKGMTMREVIVICSETPCAECNFNRIYNEQNGGDNEPSTKK